MNNEDYEVMKKALFLVTSVSEAGGVSSLVLGWEYMLLEVGAALFGTYDIQQKDHPQHSEYLGVVEHLKDPDLWIEAINADHSKQPFFEWNLRFEDGHIRVQRVTHRHIHLMLDVTMTNDIVGVQVIPKGGMN